MDLALLAVQDETTADLDRTIWDTVTRSVKTAVKVIHNVERVESLADHFAQEERAKAHLEHVVTDTRRPVKEAAVAKRAELIKKRQTAPSAGPGAWTHRDFENLLEVYNNN